jgi:hypothetical protein
MSTQFCAAIAHSLLLLCNYCTIFDYNGLRMPEIVRLSNSKICIFPGDHAPPHFHLMGLGWAVQSEIASLELMRGRAPRRDLAEAIEWASAPENLALLAREWRRLNERE